jgi:hypothetical protein
MTEELISLYKELYKNGGILYRPRQDQRLVIVFTPPTKVHSQHIFPEYEYSITYAQRLLKQLRK